MQANNQIRDIMNTNLHNLSENSSVLEAAQEMSSAHTGDVLVTHDDGSLCGIVTDRDIVTRVLAQGKDPSGTRLSEICTRDPKILEPSASTDDAVRLMTDNAIRRIPVVENRRVVGMISLGDLAMNRDPESALGRISAASPNN